MTFARRTLRPAAFIFLLLMLAFSVNAAAMASSVDPVTFTIQASPDKLTAPGEVAVSLTVSNASNDDMIAPVTLYGPDGGVVASFGDGGSYLLRAGE